MSSNLVKNGVRYLFYKSCLVLDRGDGENRPRITKYIISPRLIIY